MSGSGIPSVRSQIEEARRAFRTALLDYLSERVADWHVATLLSHLPCS
jgi:hypothetical protein